MSLILMFLAFAGVIITAISVGASLGMVIEIIEKIRESLSQFLGAEEKY